MEGGSRETQLREGGRQVDVSQCQEMQDWATAGSHHDYCMITVSDTGGAMVTVAI